MNDTTSRNITVAEMAPHIHSFAPGENKVKRLTEWLVCWIKASLKNGKIKHKDKLPSKSELACHIGVSQGTMQNVFRCVEDLGFVESKQKTGTFVKGFGKSSNIEKLTSKRELAVERIKKYIIDENYKMGEILISTRKLASVLDMSDTTIRLAVFYLESQGVLKKVKNSFVINDLSYSVAEIEPKSLVEKIADNMRNYILAEFKDGDKIPSNSDLVKKFNVSIKTVHDAVKLLSKEGLLCTRRGRYGTIVKGNAADLYRYEKIEHKIRGYISESCKIGDKLPSIKDFAHKYNTSEKTVKNALDNLVDDGYVTFARGRYGGTFVTDIPQSSGEAYKWLAINTEYSQSRHNT